jgi:hypothetical protein
LEGFAGSEVEAVFMRLRDGFGIIVQGPACQVREGSVTKEKHEEAQKALTRQWPRMDLLRT